MRPLEETSGTSGRCCGDSIAASVKALEPLGWYVLMIVMAPPRAHAAEGVSSVRAEGLARYFAAVTSARPVADSFSQSVVSSYMLNGQ
jgi:hypothetical protein